MKQGIFAVILLTQIIGCFSQDRKIEFINQSGMLIDSVTISVSSADIYTIKFLKIKTNDSVVSILPKKIPKSNKHDITVSVTVYIKNQEAIYEYSYNDLIGYLSHDYIITLNNQKKLEWRSR